MRCFKIEKKKALIIHGWLHSAQRYYDLSQRLSELSDVDIYEFEGFGKIKFEFKKVDILNYYVEKLGEYLEGKEYDLVITHSMGGNILLKVLCKAKYKINTVILSNTAYQGIPILKPVVWMLPLTAISLMVSKIIPKRIIKPIFKKVSLLTIKDEKYFDEIMFNDALCCSSIVASITILQLAFDRFLLECCFLQQ